MGKPIDTGRSGTRPEVGLPGSALSTAGTNPAPVTSELAEAQEAQEQLHILYGATTRKIEAERDELLAWAREARSLLGLGSSSNYKYARIRSLLDRAPQAVRSQVETPGDGGSAICRESGELGQSPREDVAPKGITAPGVSSSVCKTCGGTGDVCDGCGKPPALMPEGDCPEGGWVDCPDCTEVKP